jgi:hypothetical protein
MPVTLGSMPARGSITSNSYTLSVRGPRDRALAELAARQHGVVSRPQLMALGFTNTVIVYSVRVGRLHRLHHGVYAIGHTVLGANGRRMAAVLAGGHTAALFRTSAGAL